MILPDIPAIILHALDHIPTVWLFVTIFLFMTFETSLLIGLLLPGDVVVLAASASLHSPPDIIIGGICATLGALIGQSGGYAIGRKLGHRIRGGLLARWIKEEDWQKAQTILRQSAGIGILAAQFLPVVHATLPVVAGIIRLPYRRFALFAGIGSTLWAAVYVGAGALLGQFARAHPSQLGLVVLLALTIMFGMWAAGFWLDRKFLKPRRQAKADRKKYQK